MTRTAAVAAHHHVLRLEVAVDEPGRVGGAEPAARRGEDVRISWRVRVALREPGRQRLSVDVLHRQEHALVDGPRVVNHDDVGVRISILF